MNVIFHSKDDSDSEMDFGSKRDENDDRSESGHGMVIRQMHSLLHVIIVYYYTVVTPQSFHD